MDKQDIQRATRRSLLSDFYWGDRFTKAAWISAPILLICFIVFLIWILPLASAESIRAGLTLVAGILGVVIAAVLVIMAFFIDQRAGAEALFARHFDFFRGLIQKNGSIIQAGREQFVSWLLSQPGGSLRDLAPSPYDYAELKKCVTALSSLSAAVGMKDFDKIASPLKALGYDLDEIMELMGQSNTLNKIAPFALFELLTSALLYAHNVRIMITSDALARFFDFSQSTLIAMNQEGLVTSVKRYQATGDFLGSWSLPLSIALDIVVLLLAIFIIFGVTEISVHSDLIGSLVYLCAFGFVSSVVLLVFSFRRMLSVAK